ncbi:MAG TPA: serine/threonine-protein kinase, partial [Chthoniobacteraceae bacterium]|nr:serine/threonine-protein kinase [Chthoniobacteraceae bacterium]
MNTAEPPPETEDDPLIQLCTECGAAIDVSDEEPLAQIACPACGAAQTVSGQVDKFELQEVVGRGGMGVVYKAYDSGLDRFVALKLMRRDKGSASVIAQLEKEAEITASINHPHVVRVFTSGIDHGRFFIAMELVDKGTLDDLIHLQGRVAETQTLEVGAQIAQGLRAALQAGLIHRDVKPGNILFADSHTAKIVDFGLARLMSEEEVGGEVWGTPYYVAPEKLDRKPEDFRSDMYSLGGTLFHALAGRPPFEAEDASMVALKHLKSQAVSLQAFAPHVSGETAYVINRTLSKDPNERYQSYDELIEHLGYALEQIEAHGGQPQQKKRVVLESEEQQRAMGWMTAVMVGLIVLVGVGLFVFRKQLFKSDQEANASPAPGEVASAGAAGILPEARKKLIEGDTAGAIELLKQEAANPKVPPLQKAWANVGEGLAHLIAGDPAAAKAPFQAVVDRPQFKSKGEDEKVDFFLRDLAREMATPAPIPTSATTGLNTANHEAFAIFAYGVKDWALANTNDAGKLLRDFRNMSPTGNNAWLADLKALATNLLEDQAAFQMAVDRLKAAKRPEQRAKAVADLHK